MKVHQYRLQKLQAVIIQNEIITFYLNNYSKNVEFIFCVNDMIKFAINVETQKFDSIFHHFLKHLSK
jgi:hypothetical protein